MDRKKQNYVITQILKGVPLDKVDIIFKADRTKTTVQERTGVSALPCEGGKAKNG